MTRTLTIKVGQIYGCYIVIELQHREIESRASTPIPPKPRMVRWAVLECLCGNKLERLVSMFLKSKPPEECCCSNMDSKGKVRKSLLKKRKPLIDVLTNSKVSDCSRNAKAKGWEYSLTHEEVKALIKSPCHYCKHPGRTESQYWDYAPIFLNGIDRIDSSLGYITSNVVPCCAPCNYAKGTNTLEEFKMWMKAITTFTPKLELYKEDLGYNLAHNGLWNRTRVKAKDRGKIFEFTQEEYLRLALANCYYCGSEPSNLYSNAKKHKYTCSYNGLDRKDNALGYTFENSLSCCWDCNRAKNNYSIEEFLAYIEDLKLA